MSDVVADKVIATLASVKRIPVEKITLETNLQELGIDSLDVSRFSSNWKMHSRYRFLTTTSARSGPSMTS